MCSCSSTPCGCLTPNIPRGPRGFAGEPGPAPNITVGTVTALPAGSSPTFEITGTSPNLVIDVGLATGDTGPAGAAGANGQDATELFTSLVTFQVPLVGSANPATVGDTSWMTVGGWLYIRNAGYFRIVAINSPTSVHLANPGGTPFPGYTVSWPSGIPGNAPGTTVVTTDGTDNQVIQAAVPGAPGDTGATGPAGNPGQDALIEVVYAIPTVAPAIGQEFKIYTDSPTTPTVITGYSWNGASWVASVNLTPAAGTKIVSTGGDPNVTLPSGTVVGDYAIRTDVPSIYIKTTVSTWTLQVTLTNTFQQVATQSGGNMGTVPVYTEAVVGFMPFSETHAAPGTYTLDLQYQGIYVDANKDIDLNWDDSSFDKPSVWEFQLTNSDGSPINITYATGRWAKATGLTEPATLAAGATQMFILRKNVAGDRLIIEDTFVVANI